MLLIAFLYPLDSLDDVHQTPALRLERQKSTLAATFRVRPVPQAKFQANHSKSGGFEWTTLTGTSETKTAGGRANREHVVVIERAEQERGRARRCPLMPRRLCGVDETAPRIVRLWRHRVW